MIDPGEAVPKHLLIILIAILGIIITIVLSPLYEILFFNNILRLLGISILAICALANIKHVRKIKKK